MNIALYLPLGMAGYLSLRGKARVWAVLAGGFLLSCGMELIQVYAPMRTTSATDVANNVAGTIFGLLLGAVFEKIAGPVAKNARLRRAGNRAALSLVFVWIGYLVFPLFPHIGLYQPLKKLGIFLHSPIFTPMAALSACATWFAAGRLLRAAGFLSAPRLLAISLLAIPLQFVLVDRQPAPSDVIGAVAGFLLFLALKPADRPSLAEAFAFLLLVLLRGLAPFHWQAEAKAFGGFLNTPWQRGIQLLLEKGFYYGTAIWLLRAAGLRLWRATAVVAAMLAVIEILQTHLPGRTPEITDPVLAILLGFGLSTLWREA